MTVPEKSSLTERNINSHCVRGRFHKNSWYEFMLSRYVSAAGTACEQEYECLIRMGRKVSKDTNWDAYIGITKAWEWSPGEGGRQYCLFCVIVLISVFCAARD